MRKMLILVLCLLVILTVLCCLYVGWDSSPQASSLCPEGSSFAWSSTVDNVALVDPAIFNDHVYIETRHSVTMLDAQTGNKRWMNRLDLANSTAHPVVGEDVVVVGTQNDMVVYDAETGQEQWRYNTDSRLPASFIVSEGKLYAVFVPTKILAFSLSDGKVLWTSNGPGRDRTFPELILTGERLLVLQPGGWLYALDASSGQLEWEHHEEESLIGFVSNGQVVLVRGDEFIYNFEVDDGNLLWKIPAENASGGQSGVSPVLAGDQVIWAANDGALRSAAVQDGEMRWTVKTGAEIIASPLVAGDEKIWVRLIYPSDKLLSLDSETGEKLSEVSVSHSFLLRPLGLPGPTLSADRLYWVVDKQIIACDLPPD